MLLVKYFSSMTFNYKELYFPISIPAMSSEVSDDQDGIDDEHPPAPIDGIDLDQIEDESEDDALAVFFDSPDEKEPVLRSPKSLQELCKALIVKQVPHNHPNLSHGQFPEHLRAELRSMRNPRVVKAIEEMDQYQVLSDLFHDQCMESERFLERMWRDTSLKKKVKRQTTERAKNHNLRKVMRNRNGVLKELKETQWKLEKNARVIRMCERMTGLVPGFMKKEQKSLYKKYNELHHTLKRNTYYLKYDILHMPSDREFIIKYLEINYKF